MIGRRSKGSEQPRDPEGRMTLAAHLRELRSRLVKAILAIAAGGVFGLVFYQQIIDAFIGPFKDVAESEDLTAEINFGGIADPFVIPLKIALLVGVILASPVWIYQIWAFVTPGLYRNERKWTALVIFTSVPLFLAGIALCFWLLPRGLAVILGFTPDDVANIVLFSDYLSFVMRLVLVFGIAFLLPVFVVLLNAVGVLSRETLSSTRRWTVLGIFVFAAIATPTGDPITMLMLAGPMWILFEAAVLVCRLNDRRRAREAGPAIDDDVASELELEPADPSDNLPSRLDDDVT
ncbi:MAG TPA: twin-arginine translocase subunit TatC [Jiangellaceae bacterium]|jgi:sec-independent protein translocase protein TatC|nr:twin-arginine translocase subunit TatC [Jiangellaceae bacterium]